MVYGQLCELSRWQGIRGLQSQAAAAGELAKRRGESAVVHVAHDQYLADSAATMLAMTVKTAFVGLSVMFTGRW